MDFGKSSKPLVLAHASCADGFGAAFAAWMRFKDEAEYVFCRYGDEANNFDPTFCDGRDVYILDFSFPKMIMDSIMALATRVVWLDHHKTAFEMWCGKFESGMRWTSESAEGDSLYVILDDNRSGAMLAWHYFHPGEEVPMVIRHVDDYDRWQFKIDSTKEFVKALWSYAPWSFQQWQDMFLDLPYPIDICAFYAEGAAILRAHEQTVAGIVKSATRGCLIQVIAKRPGLGAPWNAGREQRDNDADYEVLGLSANCPPSLTSDVGHALATKCETFGLCWTFPQEGMTAKCSLRSNGDYDVSAIAKVFGGGGHKNAAGFEVPIETLLSWLK